MSATPLTSPGRHPVQNQDDPESFGPPPKNVNYHGGAAVPDAITPDRRGIGAPLRAVEIRAQEEAERREARAAEEAARKPAPPPIPYRVDTSGLKTSNLPKPPVRRSVEEDQSPAPSARPAAKPKPSLPPRLPPRQGSIPIASSPSPPPAYSLTGELQSRFPDLSTGGQTPDPRSQGTSLAEKQAAIKTAQSFRNDPSSVSMSDARNTAATANNFRERHGDQVNAGWKSANAFNRKHDVGNRLNSFASQGSAPSMADASKNPSSPMLSSPTSLPVHKRAPPPPPQKPSFSGGSATSPPPVPLSSKPRT
ncbi:MAG: hypothetical protein L6R39_005717 [Caloplaca ligustica]|nr:MAG: hypothetical protein L6R39_005717 [Caloplaca ligustica]